MSAIETDNAVCANAFVEMPADFGVVHSSPRTGSMSVVPAAPTLMTR